MAKIHRLPPHLANQIAAGEVIERPASAAKELAENALDAGASRIEILACDGGRLVRVTDDGEGMAAEDAALAFERFATSKLGDASDLFRLRTMGFRGEALASLGAVAKVELTTRQAGARSGTRVRLAGGSRPEIGPCGCPEGTTVEYTELFFNTPARLKFLKTPATELGHVVESLTALALAHPRVAFWCKAGARVALDTSGARDLAEAAALVLGAEVGLLPARAEGSAGTVEGLIAPPELIRGDRAKQWLFINGRPIRHPGLAKAVDEAFAGHIPLSRHPIYVVSLTVDPERVDFNVHPTKKEVRLADGGQLHSLLREAVGRGLRQAPPARRGLAVPVPRVPDPLITASQAMDLYRPLRESAREAAQQAFETPAVRPAPPGAGSSGQAEHASPEAGSSGQAEHVSPEAGSSGHAQHGAGHPGHTARAPHDAGPREPAGSGWGVPGQAFEPIAGREAFPWDELRLMGQLHDTYLVLEHPAGLYLVDQHNSHERYLYEQLGPGRGVAQELLLPIALDLAPDAANAVAQHVDALRGLGFVLRLAQPDGAPELQAVPALLPAAEAERTFLALVADLTEGSGVPARDPADRWRVTVACHSAIKAGDRLSERDMQRLLGQWRTCEQPFTCPHGRPTAMLIGLSELHRRCLRGMQTR